MLPVVSIVLFSLSVHISQGVVLINVDEGDPNKVGGTTATECVLYVAVTGKFTLLGDDSNKNPPCSSPGMTHCSNSRSIY